jgi:HEAT repeat protein
VKLLSRTRKPNVTALAERQDVEGLVSAAGFKDLLRDVEGRVIDRGAEVRAEAVVALGELGDEAGNGTVHGALRDPSDAVRSAAVRVLYRRGEIAPLAQSLGWLPAEKGSSRSLALRALLELKRPGTVLSVIRALVWAPGERPLAEVDVALVHTLVQADTGADVVNEVVQELLTPLSDDRDEVVERAEELLVRLAPASVQGVIAELEGGRAPERAAALLGRIGDTRALHPLIEALEHREISVRIEAASALGDLREPAAVEPLLHATRDHNVDVRAEAGKALDALGTAAVVVGMSAMVRPMIAEAVNSAVQAHGLGARNGAMDVDGDHAATEIDGDRAATEIDGDRAAGQIDRDRAAEARRPVGLLGVGGFRGALEEARAADEHSS